MTFDVFYVLLMSYIMCDLVFSYPLQQKVVTLANEKDFIAKKRAEDLMKVEYEWKSKTDKLVKTLESLQVSSTTL